jgi:hypothetical protein
MNSKYPLLDQILTEYSLQLGRQLVGYSNHCVRILENCRLLGAQADADLFQIATAFHDLGIWTNGSFDYIEASVDAFLGSRFSRPCREENEVVVEMIRCHHKLTQCGPLGSMAEVFRNADWIDVTWGIRSFGLDRRALGRVRAERPNRGFHFFLAKRTLLWGVRHPWNPLPMFRL